MLDNCPPKLEMDYSVILNKPFLLPSINWTSASAKDATLQTFKIPEDIIVNELAQIPFKASVYYRAKISLVFQVSGTPMHQGILIASAVPVSRLPYDSPTLRNSLMAAPHVFLNANEATSVVLEVPFYVNSVLAPINFDKTTFVPANQDANYAEVHVNVWNPLGVPTSGSTTVTVSVHAVFRELEFYVPHIEPAWLPFNAFNAEGFVGEYFQGIKASISKSFDSLASGLKFLSGDLLDKTREAAHAGISKGREMVRAYTGLHNPEIPKLDGRSAVQYRQNLNLVDTPNFFEKLDPYGNFTKVVDDFVFDTSVDEMNMQDILSKPQYIGSFVVKAADAAGTILWSRPISPAQEYVEKVYNDSAGSQITSGSTNLLQTFHKLSRYWKGSFNIHIQSSMTNFHFCKLIIARNYSPDVNMLTSYPDFRDAANLMTETLEFSAGGQVQTIHMPFCSPLSILPCSADYAFNALSHGMYYIYLYQPLVINGTVPTTVEFNVYISAGSDFEYFGYAVDPLRIERFPTVPVVELTSNETIFKPKFPSIEEEAEEDPPLIEFTIESATEAPVPVNMQDEVLVSRHDEETDECFHLRPIKSVRDYGRRFYNGYIQRFTESEASAARYTFEIPLALILGFTDRNLFSYGSTLEVIKSLFLGYRGGLKFKVLITGSPKAAAWYVPPSFSLGSELNWTSNEATPRLGSPYLDLLSSIFPFPERNSPPANLQLGTFYSTQTVGVEAPNYMHSAGAMAFSVQGGGVLASHCELELEIPYMSPFKFVGNSDAVTSIVPTAPNGLLNLGSLVFKVASPIALTQGVSAAAAELVLQVFTAFSDESRLGFQTYAPFVAYGARPFATLGERFLVSSIDPNALAPNLPAPPQALISSPVDLSSLYFSRST
jgi:hypothetical protein